MIFVYAVKNVLQMYNTKKLFFFFKYLIYLNYFTTLYVLFILLNSHTYLMHDLILIVCYYSCSTVI